VSPTRYSNGHTYTYLHMSKNNISPVDYDSILEGLQRTPPPRFRAPSAFSEGNVGILFPNNAQSTVQGSQEILPHAQNHLFDGRHENSVDTCVSSQGSPMEERFSQPQEGHDPYPIYGGSSQHLQQPPGNLRVNSRFPHEQYAVFGGRGKPQPQNIGTNQHWPYEHFAVHGEGRPPQRFPSPGQQPIMESTPTMPKGDDLGFSENPSNFSHMDVGGDFDQKFQEEQLRGVQLSHIDSLSMDYVKLLNIDQAHRDVLRKLTIPTLSPQRPLAMPYMVMNEGFAFFQFPQGFNDEDFVMKDVEPRRLEFDEAFLASRPTFDQIREYVQTEIFPLRDNIGNVKDFMTFCRITVNGMQDIFQKNHENVLGKLSILWKTVEDVFSSSQDNFSNGKADLEKVRQMFNELVSTQLPQQLEGVRGNLQELTRKSHELFVAHKQVLEDHGRKILELHESKETFSAAVAAQLAAAPTQHFAGLADAQNQIRELQSELRKNSEVITQLKDTQIRFQQEAVPSQIFSGLMDRVSRLEFHFGEFNSFKEHAQSALHILEDRVQQNSATIQQHVDGFAENLKKLQAEFAFCKSGTTNQPMAVHGPSDPSYFAKMDQWTVNVDKYLSGLIARIKTLDEMTRGHDNKLAQMEPWQSTDFALLRSGSQNGAANFSGVGLERIQKIEQDLSHLWQQLHALENVDHDVSKLRDSVDCLRKDFTSKIPKLEEALKNMKAQPVVGSSSFQPIPQRNVQMAELPSHFAMGKPATQYSPSGVGGQGVIRHDPAGHGGVSGTFGAAPAGQATHVSQTSQLSQNSVSLFATNASLGSAHAQTSQQLLLVDKKIPVENTNPLLRLPSGSAIFTEHEGGNTHNPYPGSALTQPVPVGSGQTLAFCQEAALNTTFVSQKERTDFASEKSGVNQFVSGNANTNSALFVPQKSKIATALDEEAALLHKLSKTPPPRYICGPSTCLAKTWECFSLAQPEFSFTVIGYGTCD
jgi:hypothetical protein